MQEISNQKATHRIEELERAKRRLEQEVQANRRRLEVESLAAKQVVPQQGLAVGGEPGSSSRWGPAPALRALLRGHGRSLQLIHPGCLCAAVAALIAGTGEAGLGTAWEGVTAPHPAFGDTAPGYGRRPPPARVAPEPWAPTFHLGAERLPGAIHTGHVHVQDVRVLISRLYSKGSFISLQVCGGGKYPCNPKFGYSSDLLVTR